MRVQHNITAMGAYRNYNNNTSALGKNLEKLSSGYKINRAGDDAAGLAISEKMRAQITGLGAAQQNAKDGISLVQTAEGALTEVHDMLNRMTELATKSSNGIYNKDDRKEIQREFEALKKEIDRIADNTKFNDINLFKSGGTQNLQIGASAAETVTVNLSNDISANKLLGAGTKVSTAAAASSAIEQIKKAITTISKYRGEFGALQNRLEHTLNNLSVTEENLQNAESAIRDTDVADEMTEYTKNNILIQSAQAMLAQANQIPQGVLQLLQ